MMHRTSRPDTAASFPGINERPLFIVGSPRSGTGLLRNMVRSHPKISIPAESHFIPHFYRSYGDPRDADEAIQLGRRIVGFPRIQEWGIGSRSRRFPGLPKVFECHCSSYSPGGQYPKINHVGEIRPRITCGIFPRLLIFFQTLRFCISFVTREPS